jgi:hypothetical protein
MLWPAVHHKGAFVVHRQALILYEPWIKSVSQTAYRQKALRTAFHTRSSGHHTLPPQNNV